MKEAREWLYEKFLLAAGLVESEPRTYLLERKPEWDEGLDCDRVNERARAAGLIGPDEYIIEQGEDPSQDPGTPRPTRWIKFYHPNRAKPATRIVVRDSSGWSGNVTRAHADQIARYLRAWAERCLETSAPGVAAELNGQRVPPTADPASLAATDRAAHDLAANLRDVLGWFDALRAADSDQAPEPVPPWWDGYIRDTLWIAGRGSPIPSPAERVRWVSGRTLDATDTVLNCWERLSGVIPFTDSERRKANAARESLRNLRGILDPMQPRLGLRLGAIPARWHRDTPIPSVWELEPQSEAERAALNKAQNAAFDVAINDGAAKGAQKRLEQANAKLQRLARERGKRNDARREKARREGLVTAEERAELVAARSWWAEQIKRWELGEKDLRELLAVLTAPRDKPAPSITAPQTLLGPTLEGKTGELDLAEAEALLKLGSRELWGVDELPEEIDADVMRCLDDHGLVEARFVTMQNRSKYRGDTTPPAPVPSSWFSPMKNPSRAGEWDKILGSRLRDYWTHPSEVRLSERGRAVLARMRWTGARRPPPSAGATHAGVDTGQTQRRIGEGKSPETVKLEAERYVQANGNVWPGLNALQRECQCGKSTLYEAIERSPYLKARRAEAETGKKGSSMVGRAGLVPSRVEHTQARPDQAAGELTDDMLARLLDAAHTEEERDRLRSMPREQIEELYALVQEDPECADLLGVNRSPHGRDRSRGRKSSKSSD